MEIQKTIVEKTGENHYIISTYEKIKKKRPNLVLEITLVESDFPLLEIRFMDLTHNIHNKIYDALLKKLPHKNYQIKSVKTNYKNGVIMLDEFDCSNENTFFDMTKFLNKTP